MRNNLKFLQLLVAALLLMACSKDPYPAADVEFSTVLHVIDRNWNQYNSIQSQTAQQKSVIELDNIVSLYIYTEESLITTFSNKNYSGCKVEPIYDYVDNSDSEKFDITFSRIVVNADKSEDTLHYHLVYYFDRSVQERVIVDSDGNPIGDANGNIQVEKYYLDHFITVTNDDNVEVGGNSNLEVLVEKRALGEGITNPNPNPGLGGGGGGTGGNTYEDTLDKVHELQPGETYDWDSYVVPASAPTGKMWTLVEAASDDFNYTAPTGDNKGAEFDAKWNPHYPASSNGGIWTGPKPGHYNPDNSYVESGALHLIANREASAPEVTFEYDGDSYTKPETNTGCISSKVKLQYPIYIESRSKVARTVVASAVWMLSADAAQEIDIIEAYGGERYTNEWFSPWRMHLSHHVFERNSSGYSADYQPDDEGTYYLAPDKCKWADGYHRVGVYWRDPYHLEYYIDGVKVRTVTGKSMIDPLGYTTNGLSAEESIIVSQGDQTWRAAQGLTPTAEEIAITENNIFRTDWIRVYKAE